MPTFQYKALDGQDRFVDGEIEADSLPDVSRRLQQLGYTVLETAAKSTVKASLSWTIFTRPVSKHDVTVFIRELALVLRAGLRLDDALQLLSDEGQTGIASVVRSLRMTINGGGTFAEALQRHPRLFGPDLVAMVRVAESSGSLESVLDSVGEERARMDGLLDKISASLRYPAFLLLVAIGVLTFFMVVVVPQFAATLRDFGPPPTGLVGFILAISDFMVRNSFVLGLGVPLTALLIAAILFQPRYRAKLSGLLLRIPVIRDIVSLRRTVLFCSSLSTLLSNGVTLTAALGVVVDLPGASAATMDAVIEGVRRGGRLVDALSKTSYIPSLALKMLRVGEESGELAIVARRTAEFYQTKLSDRLDHLASIIGPAAIVIIAGLIGTLIVSILSALLSMNQLVG